MTPTETAPLLRHVDRGHPEKKQHRSSFLSSICQHKDGADALEGVAKREVQEAETQAKASVLDVKFVHWVLLALCVVLQSLPCLPSSLYAGNWTRYLLLFLPEAVGVLWKPLRPPIDSVIFRTLDKADDEKTRRVLAKGESTISSMIQSWMVLWSVLATCARVFSDEGHISFAIGLLIPLPFLTTIFIFRFFILQRQVKNLQSMKSDRDASVQTRQPDYKTYHSNYNLKYGWQSCVETIWGLFYICLVICCVGLLAGRVSQILVVKLGFRLIKVDNVIGKILEAMPRTVRILRARKTEPHVSATPDTMV